VWRLGVVSGRRPAAVTAGQGVPRAGTVGNAWATVHGRREDEVEGYVPCDHGSRGGAEVRRDVDGTAAVPI